MANQIDKLVVTANATDSGGILNVNDYTLIDETVAGATGDVNSSNTNDQTGSAATWSSVTPMTYNITSVNTATFRVRARLQSVNNDLCTWRFRLTVGGSTYDIEYTQADTAFVDRTIAVGTGFTRAQYEAATIEVEMTFYNKSQSADGFFLEIDAFELDIDYEAIIPTPVATDLSSTGSATGAFTTVLVLPTVSDSTGLAVSNADTMIVWATDTSAVAEATSSADSGADRSVVAEATATATGNGVSIQTQPTVFNTASISVSSGAAAKITSTVFSADSSSLAVASGHIRCPLVTADANDVRADANDVTADGSAPCTYVLDADANASGVATVSGFTTYPDTTVFTANGLATVLGNTGAVVPTVFNATGQAVVTGVVDAAFSETTGSSTGASTADFDTCTIDMP